MAHVYHALMMTAMAWMYAVMNVDILPGETTPTSPVMFRESRAGDRGITHGEHSHHMPTGMDMHGITPGYVATVNAILAAVFVIATIVWLYLWVSRRQPTTDPRTRSSALLTYRAELCQMLMGAGMAITFIVVA